MTASAKCRGCGRDIEWAVDTQGQKIPLDPRPPVYAVVVAAPDGISDTILRMPNSRVSHFATCPKASEFSRGRRRAPADRSGAGEPPANTTPTVGGRRRSPTMEGPRS